MFAVFHAHNNHTSVPFADSISNQADVLALSVSVITSYVDISKSAVAHVYGTNQVTLPVIPFTEVTASVASICVQLPTKVVVEALFAVATILSHTLNTTESTVPHTETV